MALITLYCYATTTKLATVVVSGTWGAGWQEAGSLSDWERELGTGDSWVECKGLGRVGELGTW